ncbi:MAG: exodeoxyribonuclease VII large subunit [Spongiibacteraceae bacterium]
MNPPAPIKPGDVLSVSQLNRLARQLLEDCFPMIWVEGEISNLSRPSSGHWYFTLKDGGAQVRCAMFRNRNFRLKFQPAEGSKILLKGTISLYEARGDYQLIAEDMQPAGEGLLAARFEQLKQKLQSEGLFEPARKRPLPDSIAHIAVVTSATGAAIHDILTVLKRRSPSTRVTLIPVPVQGELAPSAIVRAIAVANTLVATGQQDFDVLLIGRGGGSLEDLWGFNDERVARAIVASGLPVVSAVGHEVDFTIADFVADVRAATPSAAAELLSIDQREYAQKISALRQRLLQRWQQNLTQTRQRIHWQEKRLQAQHPGQRLRQRVLRLDELELRMRQAMTRTLQDKQKHLHLLESRLQRHHPGQRLKQMQTRLAFYRKQLPALMAAQLHTHKQQLSTLAQLLNSVSPLNTLERGYAIVTDVNHHVVRAASEVKSGDKIRARLAQGELFCLVESTIAST